MTETIRSAVVTGAGSGIGRAITVALSGNGYRVHALDVDETAVKTTQESAAQDAVVAHVADVSRYEQVEAVVRAAAEETGRLDLLVNAAGVYDGYAGIDDTSPELWRRVVDINLTGAFNGCSAAVAAMPEPGGGRIVTIGSIGAVRGAADGLAYCASKAGLEGMNRRLAVDVAARGITSNVIAPGSTQTPIAQTSQRLVGDLYPAEKKGGLPPAVGKWLVPAGRPAAPEEIAELAVFLASDQAAYITGQVITIDGGWTAQ
ncbi:SDR family NAD(P)-dependent oxidoreductase [Streptomyces sp. BH106]|uniref:SDR family NAD(P)-dependent oxidoreductase n=1 Tax=Streptomyces sp. BH106 TaxID=3410409 RepID=UPI003CE88665